MSCRERAAECGRRPSPGGTGLERCRGPCHAAPPLPDGRQPAQHRGSILSFVTLSAADAATVPAPDGSVVQVLCGAARGSMALFTLAPHAVARAVAHRTVEEIWYVLAGQGRMWRKLHDQEQTVALAPGLSLTLPTGTAFQFRCDGAAPLTVLGITMPPWPGATEAFEVAGPWRPTV